MARVRYSIFDISDFVGSLIDTSDVDENKRFAISINQTFFFLLNQMMAIDRYFMLHCNKMIIFNQSYGSYDSYGSYGCYSLVIHFQF
jgi:hypothetical protein